MVKRIIRLLLLILGLLVLLGATLFVALRWESIPAEIPTNYNGAGQPEAYSGKGALWGMLVTGWLMFALSAAVSRFPALLKKNGGFVRVNALRIGGRTIEPSWLSLDLMSTELALLFGYMAVCSALCRPLGAWFLPAVLIGLLLSFVVPTVLGEVFR